MLIYHGVVDSAIGYLYKACAALLDINNPHIEIGKLPYPLFSPDLGYEQGGQVDNVCFPTANCVFGDTLYIYYGASDQHIACASTSLSALLKELKLNPPTHEQH